MATAPTRVAFASPASGNYTTSGTSKTTAAFSVTAGDLVVVVASSEQAGTNSAVTPTATGGSITWTLRASQTVGGANQSGAWLWTGVVGATAASITVTVPRPNTGTALWWGCSATVWRGHAGVGQVVQTGSGTASSIAQATTPALAANSAVQVAMSDWNAVAVASRSWQTINGAAMTESLYTNGASHATAYGAFRTDVGAAGTKVVGLTTPATLRWTMVGVEIVGAASGGGSVFAAASSVAASTAVVGAASALLLAGGVVAGTTGVTGDPTRLAQTYAASGTVAGATAVGGSATRVPLTLAAAGSVAATTGVAGDAIRLGQTYSATGSTPAVSAVTGAVVARLTATGATAATTGVTGTATARLGATGATAATTTVTGSPNIIGGPAMYAASGVVATVSTTNGTATARLRSAGTSPATSAVSGSPSLVAGPVTYQAVSAASGTTAIAGTVTYVARITGTVAATSDATGAADTYDPDYVPPELEVGPVAPPRFTAAAARVPTVAATRTGHSLSAGPPLPSRYRRQT